MGVGHISPLNTRYLLQTQIHLFSSMKQNHPHWKKKKKSKVNQKENKKKAKTTAKPLKQCNSEFGYLHENLVLLLL